MLEMVFAEAGKKGTREAVRKIRDSMPAKEVEQKSTAIVARLLQLREYTGAKTVLFYAAKGNEVQIAAAIRDAFVKGKNVLLPVTDTDNKIIYAAAIANYPDDLEKAAFGLMEPKLKNPFKGGIDLVVMPGVAFERHGHRLGYGHGYYDKFLHSLRKENPNVVAVAVAYDFQIVETLPSGSHDQRMDAIITENGIIRCGSGDNA